MPQLTRSVEIPQRPEELWQKIGSFASIRDWHPMVDTISTQEDRRLRQFKTTKGAEQTERLLDMDNAQHMYIYSMESSDLPVMDCTATFQLIDGGESGCHVHWSADFLDMSGDAGETTEAIDAFITSGLENLQRLYA